MNHDPKLGTCDGDKTPHTKVQYIVKCINWKPNTEEQTRPTPPRGDWSAKAELLGARMEAGATPEPPTPAIRFICGHGTFDKPCEICKGSYHNAVFDPIPAVTSSGAQPPDWSAIVAEANRLRKLLDSKPDELKLGNWGTPGSILNAYREGDLNFDKAVSAIENWAERGAAQGSSPAQPQIQTLCSADIGKFPPLSFICRHGTFPNPCKDCQGIFTNSDTQP